MQLRIFRHVTPSLLRHSLCTRCHFNTRAPATEIGGIKPLIPHQPCWHGLDKEKLEACAPPKRQPEELRKLIEEAKVPPAKNREPSPRRKPDVMGRWLCNKCGQMLFAEEFCKRLKGAYVPGTCKTCERKYSLQYQRTLRGSLKAVLASAQRRARMKGLEFNLSYSELLDMLEFQNGKCAYSGVNMEVEQPNSHWRMSLERVDNRTGYMPSNCVFVACEFNSCDFSQARNVDPEAILGTAQWSAHKVEEVGRLRNQEVDLHKLAIDIEVARQREIQPRRPRIPHSMSPCVLHGRQCPSCLQVLSPSAFYTCPSAASGMSSYCVDCTRQRQRSYLRSLRGHLCQSLYKAQRRASAREQDFCITKEVLLDLLAGQGGRCFYSGIPLRYDQVHIDWRLSIERLDNSVGYTPGNCVLIAVEFNTSDHSRNKAVTEVFGTAQWSREKVRHVWGF